MHKKCSFPPGITIKPNGKDELDPCLYEIEEEYRNVTVQVLRCQKCGSVEISWKRQPNTVCTVYGGDEVINIPFDQ